MPLPTETDTLVLTAALRLLTASYPDETALIEGLSRLIEGGTCTGMS